MSVIRADEHCVYKGAIVLTGCVERVSSFNFVDTVIKRDLLSKNSIYIRTPSIGSVHSISIGRLDIFLNYELLNFV